MSFSSVSICICVVLVSVVSSIPLFHNGRFKNGLLPPPPSKGLHDHPSQWFTQRLDHFDPQNLGTFQQQYFMNDKFFVAGGPVFLMIGGEGPAASIWVDEGMMSAWAQEFHAMIFYVEHRFYGLSQPFEDLSTEHLAFLTSEQALADLAYFQQAISQQSRFSGASWISFGGSYSGALSAWFRLKYPHAVVGAVASSAPVLPVLDFTQYLEVVTQSLTTMSGVACVSNVAQATSQLQAALATPGGRAALSTQFNLCSDLTEDSDDIANLVSALAGNFMGVVQYNNDNRAFEGAVDGNVTIPVICALMNDTSVPPLQRYANVNALVLKTYGTKCLDFSYSNFIAEMTDISLSGPASGGGRQWTYQTCAEFGYYQTSDSDRQPFGALFPVAFSIQQCVDIYGARFDRKEISDNVAWSLAEYGGTKIGATNIIFPNGLIDPWHALGILSTGNGNLTAVVISDTAHCADMYPARDSDPTDLIAARQVIHDTIQSWI